MDSEEIVTEIAEALSKTMQQLAPGIAAKHGIADEDAHLNAALGAVRYAVDTISSDVESTTAENLHLYLHIKYLLIGFVQAHSPDDEDN